jgi:hypothetical protein
MKISMERIKRMMMNSQQRETAEATNIKCYKIVTMKTVKRASWEVKSAPCKYVTHCLPMFITVLM